MTQMPVLETLRLRIRPFSADDLHFVHRLLDGELQDAELGTAGVHARFEPIADLFAPRHRRKMVAGRDLDQRLHISPGDDVVRALRRRIVDGQPMALEEIRLPAVVVPHLARSDFESASLYQRLRDHHGVTPANAIQTTEPTVTDAEESRLLGVPLYSPALQFERTTQDVSGRTIEFTRSVYRGDRYRITSHLTFGPNSG